MTKKPKERSYFSFYNIFFCFSLPGENSNLTYSLPKGIAKDRFLLDPTNGRLTTAVSLDREEQSSYVFTGMNLKFYTSTFKTNIGKGRL